MARKEIIVTIGDDRLPFLCHVCDGYVFVDREVKINTSGAEFFDSGWANKSGTGLVCQKCGYLHVFMFGIELWAAEDGYPAADD